MLQSVDLAVDKCIYKGIDLIINGRYFEIKSCQLRISRSDPARITKTRAGSFILDLEQHNDLVRLDGFYIFVVSHNDALLDYKVLKAKYIKYKRWLAWTTIWKNKYVLETRLGELPKSIRNAISDNR